MPKTQRIWVYTPNICVINFLRYNGRESACSNLHHTWAAIKCLLIVFQCYENGNTVQGRMPNRKWNQKFNGDCRRHTFTLGFFIELGHQMSDFSYNLMSVSGRPVSFMLKSGPRILIYFEFDVQNWQSKSKIFESWRRHFAAGFQFQQDRTSKRNKTMYVTYREMFLTVLNFGTKSRAIGQCFVTRCLTFIAVCGSPYRDAKYYITWLSNKTCFWCLTFMWGSASQYRLRYFN